MTLDVLRRAPVEWLQPVRRLKDYRGARGRLTFQPVSSLGRSFLVESRHEAIRLRIALTQPHCPGTGHGESLRDVDRGTPF